MMLAFLADPEIVLDGAAKENRAALGTPDPKPLQVRPLIWLIETFHFLDNGSIVCPTDRLAIRRGVAFFGKGPL